MEKKYFSRIPTAAAYCYFAVPFLIFVWGWFRLPAAVIATVLLVGGTVLAVRDAPRTDVTVFTKPRNIFPLLAAVLLAAVWVYYSGIGGFSFQNYDFKWRNALLKLLVEQPWPVTVADTAPYFEGPVALVYYFAFWLPSALFGKWLGLRAAEIFLYFWSLLGVLLVFYFLCEVRGKFTFTPLFIFIFFGGLDIAGTILFSNTSAPIFFTTVHIENWAFGFQYSSITTQLYWVFNQAIPAWLLTLLLLSAKNNRNRVYIYGFSLIFCTLPAIGMLPVAVCLAVVRLVRQIRERDRAKKFRVCLGAMAKELFTPQNVLTGGLTGLSSFLFLRINKNGSTMEMNDMKTLLASYLIFILLEAVVYFAVIWSAERKNVLFYLSLALLLFIPFIKVGEHVDFVMRASIPAMVILCVLLTDALDRYGAEKKRVLAVVLVCLLVLGSFSAVHELLRSLTNSVNAIRTARPVPIAEEIDLLRDSKRANFFAEYADSLFFRIFGK